MGELKSKVLTVFLATIIVVSPLVYLVGAKTAQADFDCMTLTASSTADQRTYCQDQINTLEAQLQVLDQQLAAQKNQSGTLQGDITVLTTQINAKKLEIQTKQLTINQLGSSITQKQQTITALDQKMENEKDSLAQLLRKTNEMDSTTLTSFLLSDQSLSDFYSDVSNFDSLKSDVKASVDQIDQIEGVTISAKAELQKEQDATVDEQSTLQEAQQNIEQDQATQKQLLAASKTKETQYQQVIAGQQAKVAAIKAKLFSLAGGSSAIRFDVALQYAETAQQSTGIDPAFLLAELTQESNLGQNVGQCYLTNDTTGAGVGANTGRAFSNVMKPTRDVQPFIAITTALGFDPHKTVVSCPIAGVAGYGGAMGPAQFIASTWQLFAPRIEKNLNESVANPWAAQDAFMAASLYLTDLGGVGSSASAQLRASCKYYGSGGATCSYGRSVQTLRASIQANIDYLNQYGVAKQ